MTADQHFECLQVAVPGAGNEVGIWVFHEWQGMDGSAFPRARYYSFQFVHCSSPIFFNLAGFPFGEVHNSAGYVVHVIPKDVQRDISNGLTDGEIVETVANVALNIFGNYMNHVARTVVDFAERKAGQVEEDWR